MAKGKRGRPPNPQTAHRQAAAWLRSQLTAARWPIGQPIASLRQLAKASGFSFGAVRQAVEQMKHERRLHVSPYQRLVVTRLVDSPMDGRDHLLVVSSNPLSAHLLDILNGILLGAGELGIPVTVAHAHGFEFALPVGFLNLPLKGIVLLGHFWPACLKQYEALHVPVVLADQPTFGKKLGAVSVDNHAAAGDATRRLIQAGHRRIAFVRRLIYHLEDVDPDSKERMAGYAAALKEAGIQYRREAVFNVLPERKRPTYPLHGLFKSSPPFTAAVCTDEHAAEVVAKTATAFGRRIPFDLGVVCFQSVQSTGPYAGPASDFRSIGLEASRLLRKWTTPAPQLRVPCVWRERGSWNKRG